MRQRIISRRAWTSTKPGGEPLDPPIDTVLLHHDAGPWPEGGRNARRGVEEALLRGIRDFHVNGRGMSDIAYNFAQMPSGRRYALRGIRTGGHTFGYNSKLAIVFIGNYEIAKPTKDSIEGASFILRSLRKRKKITRAFSFLGHREVGAQGGGTACPGRNLFEKKGEIKRGV
jgi:hypothetical protein